MLYKAIIMSGALWLMAAGAHARDPIGEVATYNLDKNGGRTTGLIQSGSAIAKATEFLPNHPSGPSYNVSLNYDFTVQFYGRQTGQTKWEFPQEFFQPDFIRRLRETGAFETPDYKIRHEGYADARNLDGSFYSHCDKVLIYDIRIPDLNFVSSILYAASGYSPQAAENPPIENLKIRALLYDGVPVLGAVKLDLSGVVQGINAKAGFDLKR